MQQTLMPGAHTFYNICTRMLWHFVFQPWWRQLY